MQTHLAEWIRDTPAGLAAEAILRKCVHCGFCNATCPTYQLRGDELDGPRGRIYLIKQMLEGEPVSSRTALHLDRCLTCRACETTCPSGVEYGKLADIGRAVVEEKLVRSWIDRAQRYALAAVLPRPWLFAPLLHIGRMLRAHLPSLMPAALAAKVPAHIPRARAWPASHPTARHARRMLVLAGCVQPTLSPDINAAAARVLDRIGISLIQAEGAGCCGALRYHLNYQSDGLDDMRRLIDAWWPAVERGEIEAIVMTASGCGVTVKEYGHYLADDPAYRDKAARISAITRDIAEVLDAESAALSRLVVRADIKMSGREGGNSDAGEIGTNARIIAFHPPCTLQHGQQIRGVAERILAAAGFELMPVPDAHLCCGSAGTYALLQPALSSQLQTNKLAALQSGGAQMILTANIGCQSHLAAGARVPVRHWVVALDERLAAAGETP